MTRLMSWKKHRNAKYLKVAVNHRDAQPVRTNAPDHLSVNALDQTPQAVRTGRAV